MLKVICKVNLGLSTGWTKALEAETGFVIHLWSKRCSLGAFRAAQRAVPCGAVPCRAVPCGALRWCRASVFRMTHNLAVSEEEHREANLLLSTCAPRHNLWQVTGKQFAHCAGKPE